MNNLQSTDFSTLRTPSKLIPENLEGSSGQKKITFKDADEKLSVKSLESIGSRSEHHVAEHPLKTKLLHEEYTYDSTVEILIQWALGNSHDNAQRLSRSISDSLNTIQMSDLKKSVSENTDEQRGRALLEMIMNAIQQLGEGGVAVVKSNFQLSEFILSIQKDRNATEVKLNTLHVNTTSAIKLDERINQLICKQDIADTDASLLRTQRFRFECRINQRTRRFRTSESGVEGQPTDSSEQATLEQDAAATLSNLKSSGTSQSTSPLRGSTTSTEDWLLSREYQEYEELIRDYTIKTTD